MAPRESANNRLSVDDWIQAGYTILAEEGLQALKIDRLCKRLGVTKGSFYWHFTDLAGYRSVLIESWAEQRGAQHPVYQQIGEHPPGQRLGVLVDALLDPRHWKLARTMREWARIDPTVAAGVESADRRVLRMVRQTFLDLGFAPDEAELRAHTTFAAGIGFLQIAGTKTRPLSTAQRAQFVEFMLR